MQKARVHDSGLFCFCIVRGEIPIELNFGSAGGRAAVFSLSVCFFSERMIFKRGMLPVNEVQEAAKFPHKGGFMSKTRQRDAPQ
jgi:hypothetical protein